MRSSRHLVQLLVSPILLVVAACGGAPPMDSGTVADLVLRGGRVVTVDSAMPEAEAIAIGGDTIIAVGTDDDIALYIGDATEVIELDGMMAMPGFIESHAHFVGIGDAKMQLDLMTVSNWDEIVAMVGAAARDAGPDELIRGRGWHQEKWDRPPSPSVGGLPTHASLDSVSPNNPVVLRHASGHASFANARAMELAGITRDTPDPSGGEIVKDENGDPIGMFRETAQGLLAAASRNAAPPDPDRQIELAIEEVLSKGITTLHDAGSGFDTIDRLKARADAGTLGLRLYVMVRADNDALRDRIADYRMIGVGDDALTVRAIKVTIDGALGPHGAWLLESYADLPSSSGLNTRPIASLEETAAISMEHDLQLNVHAIGDRANREVLDVFERAFAANPERTDPRWRIEHAQHLNAQDIPRYGELGVIAAMQGIHATSDAPWVIERLGEARAEEGAYVWQKLMQSGAVIANGTDAPVEDVSPIASYYATVSRKLADGTVWFGDQRMSRLEALRSYTLNGAFAAFEEDTKGSVVPGKLADITVLSKDITTIPEDEIPTTEVVYTIVGGVVMYRRDAANMP
ncbi:MAG: amidohydrolase [Longimicrobiales bacterium]